MSANLEDEQEIVWLHPPERYSYLRETTTTFSQRRAFPKYMLPGPRNNDGGEGTHLVAYTILKPKARSSWPGFFYRRYWWVKSYDRFEGHGTDNGGSYYEKGGPCEAVIPASVLAGKPSTPGWNP